MTSQLLRRCSAVAILIPCLALLGCQKQEGPAEKAGKELDQAVKNMGEQMEKAGQDIQKAAKDAKK